MLLLMPGRSHRGPLPPLTDVQIEISGRSRRIVDLLAGVIGDRNVIARYDNLQSAATYLEKRLRELDFEPASQSYEIRSGRTVRNIDAELPGGSRRDEIVVLGAHYDSVAAFGGCPGANDNGSGVAAVLEVARLLQGRKLARTLRYVLFVNEEPPFFQTEQMGSLVYARRCRQRGEKIVGMLTPETIGFYSDAEGSQTYPIPVGPLLPRRGDFIAFVGNLRSRKLVTQAVRSFRKHAQFPSEGAALPEGVTGVGFSDHWSFWQAGYPALMITDTAPFRYPHYHKPADTPDKIDYDRMARVIDGLAHVVLDLCGGEALQ